MDYNSSTDVRIIVDSASDMEIVSKALKNLTIEDDYNVVISSLISTKSFDLIKKAVNGADVVLVTTREYMSTDEFNSNYVEVLTNDVGHIERINFSDIEEREFVDSDFIGKRIKNALIRAGLSSIKILNYFHEMEKQNNNLLIKINELNKEIKDINSKNYELAEKLENQININNNFQVEIKSNTKRMDKLTEKYNNLKSKNTYFEEKQLNEVFNLHNLWMETFNESIKNYERIIFATNQFKPKNIIIGQGLISALDKETAIQWLKVVKTALFFIDSKNNEYGDINRDLSENYGTEIYEDNEHVKHNSEIPSINEKTVKKEKEDINSRIMNLWE